MSRNDVGAAVRSGLREAGSGVRHGRQAGEELSRLAFERVEKQLAEYGRSLNDIPELLARKTTGLSRKQLVKQRKHARKQFERQAGQARKQLDTAVSQARTQLASAIEPAPAKRGRWWLWGLVTVAIATAAVATWRSRPDSADSEFNESESANA
jgi:hypothetical protein